MCFTDFHIAVESKISDRQSPCKIDDYSLSELEVRSKLHSWNKDQQKARKTGGLQLTLGHSYVPISLAIVKNEGLSGSEIPLL